MRLTYNEIAEPLMSQFMSHDQCHFLLRFLRRDVRVNEQIRFAVGD